MKSLVSPQRGLPGEHNIGNHGQLTTSCDMYLCDIKKSTVSFFFFLIKALPGDQRVEGQNSFLVCMCVCSPIANNSSGNDTLVSGVVDTALCALPHLTLCYDYREVLTWMQNEGLSR